MQWSVSWTIPKYKGHKHCAYKVGPQTPFIDTEGDAHVGSQTHRKCFESRWLQEDNIMQVVSNAWERSDPTAPIAERTTSVHSTLHEWDRSILKAPQRRLKELKEELEKLRLGPLTDEAGDM